MGNVRGQVKGDPVEIVSSRPFKSGFIVKLAGIDDRNEAELWKERYFLLPIDETAPLEEGTVYLHELEGMRVDLVTGDMLAFRLMATWLPLQSALANLPAFTRTSLQVPPVGSVYL